MQQIHIIVVTLYTWRTTEIHLANQIICAGWQTHTKLHTLFKIDSHKIIIHVPCFGQTHMKL